MRWPAYSGATSSSWTPEAGEEGVVMARIITIFYGFEALNDYCYSRERRQKRPGFGVFANTATPQPLQPFQDVRPSDRKFAAMTANFL